MRARWILRGSWVLLAGTAMLVGPGAPVAADCSTVSEHLVHVSDARGTTFLGTYLGTDDRDPPRERWRVHETYSGGPPHGSAAYVQSVCVPIPMEAGGTYLFSTSVGTGSRHPVGVEDAVAWQVGEDGTAQLIVPPLGDPADYYPEVVLAVRTLSEGIGLLAPTLPPTDSAAAATSRGHGGSQSLLLLMGLAAGIAAAWVYRRDGALRS